MAGGLTLQSAGLGFTILGWLITTAGAADYWNRRRFGGEWRFWIRWENEWRPELFGPSATPVGDVQSIGAVHLSYKGGSQKLYFGAGHFQLQAGGKRQRWVGVELSRLGMKRNFLSRHVLSQQLTSCALSTLYVQLEACRYTPPKREYRIEFHNSTHARLEGDMYFESTKVGRVEAERR
jgi:hypothetical protein